MKLGDVQYPKKEELNLPPAIAGDWFDRILLAMNTNARTFEQTLRDNVEFPDNTPYRFVTTSLQHGAESLIANPLPNGRRCKGALVLNCDGGLQPVGSPIVRNTSKGDVAQLGVTVNFDLAHTRPSMEMSLSVNTAARANNTEITVTEWDVTDRSVGGIITHSAGIFTVSEAGLYDVFARLRWEAGTYTAVQVAIYQNANFKTSQFLPYPSTATPELTVSWPIALAAGGTTKVTTSQINTPAAGRTTLGGVFGSKVAIARRYNDSVPTANVTLLLISE